REDRAGIGARAPAGAQDAEGLEDPEGLAYRGPGHLEDLGQLPLGGEAVADREAPFVNGVLDLHDDVFEGPSAFDRSKGRCEFFHPAVLPLGQTFNPILPPGPKRPRHQSAPKPAKSTGAPSSWATTSRAWSVVAAIGSPVFLWSSDNSHSRSPGR